MSYPKETARCLLYLFPDSVSDIDWSVTIHDDDTATIDLWKDSLGKQPTEAEVKAVVDEAVKSYKFIRIRKNRDHLLKETDWLGNSDVEMSAEWEKYRKDLRDLPASNADPDKIIFPDKPK